MQPHAHGVLAQPQADADLGVGAAQHLALQEDGLEARLEAADRGEQPGPRLASTAPGSLGAGTMARASGSSGRGCARRCRRRPSSISWWWATLVRYGRGLGVHSTEGGEDSGCERGEVGHEGRRSGAGCSGRSFWIASWRSSGQGIGGNVSRRSCQSSHHGLRRGSPALAWRPRDGHASVSDERLREAERRWRATGSVEDEVRLLYERLRVGDLRHEQVALAAHCGSQAAQVVAEVQAAEPGTESWLEGVEAIGSWARARVAGLMTDWAVGSYRPSQGTDPTDAIATDAFRAWAADQSEESRAAIDELAEIARDAANWAITPTQRSIPP